MATMRPRRGRRALAMPCVLAAVALAAVACSLTLPLGREQCSSDEDCARLQAGTTCQGNVCQAATPVIPTVDGGAWGCVGGDPLAADGGVPATLQVVPYDGFSTLNPEANPYVVRTGVTVRLCPKRDPACSAPLSSAITVTGDEGAVFPMPTSTRELYVEITGTGITPMLFFPAIAGDGAARFQRPLLVGTLAPESTAALAGLLGQQVDSNAGILLTRVLNCETFPAESGGVRFVAEPLAPSTKAFYTSGGAPSPTTTATDADGLGGFVNVPPALVTVRTSFADTGQRIGTASALVRAGWMTLVEVAPSRN